MIHPGLGFQGSSTSIHIEPLPALNKKNGFQGFLQLTLLKNNSDFDQSLQSGTFTYSFQAMPCLPSFAK
jgi:hypothetical protein